MSAAYSRRLYQSLVIGRRGRRPGRRITAGREIPRLERFLTSPFFWTSLRREAHRRLIRART